MMLCWVQTLNNTPKPLQSWLEPSQGFWAHPSHAPKSASAQHHQLINPKVFSSNPCFAETNIYDQFLIEILQVSLTEIYVFPCTLLQIIFSNLIKTNPYNLANLRIWEITTEQQCQAQFGLIKDKRRENNSLLASQVEAVLYLECKQPSYGEEHAQLSFITGT